MQLHILYTQSRKYLYILQMFCVLYFDFYFLKKKKQQSNVAFRMIDYGLVLLILLLL